MAYSYARARRTVHRQIRSYGGKVADLALLVRKLDDGTVVTRRCRAARLEYSPKERRLFEDGGSRILISGLSLTLNNSEAPDNQLDMIYFAGALYKIILPIEGFRQDPSTVIFYDCHCMYSQKADYIKGVTLGPVRMDYGYKQRSYIAGHGEYLQVGMSFGFDMLAGARVVTQLAAEMEVGFDMEAQLTYFKAIRANFGFGFDMLAQADVTQFMQASMDYGFNTSAIVSDIKPGTVWVAGALDFGFDMMAVPSPSKLVKAAMTFGFDMLAAASKVNFIVAGMGYGADLAANLVTASASPLLAVVGHANSPYVQFLDENYNAFHSPPAVMPAAAVLSSDFSRNGKWLVMVEAAAVTMHDLSSGVPVAVSNPFGLSPPSWASMSEAKFSFDSRFLALCNSTNIWIFEKDASGSGWTLHSNFNPGSITSAKLAWHPSGSRLAVGGSSSPYISVYDFPSNTLRTALSSVPAAACGSLAYSPDGRFLAAYSLLASNVLHAWKVSDDSKMSRSGTPNTSITGLSAFRNMLSWQEDSKRIIHVGGSGVLNTLFWADISDSGISYSTYTGSPDPGTVTKNLAFTPNGNALVTLSQAGAPNLLRYNASRVQEANPLAQPTGSPQSVSVRMPLRTPITVIGSAASPYAIFLNSSHVKLADPATLPPSLPQAGALSPDMRTAVVASPSALYFYDLSSGAPVYDSGALPSPITWANISSLSFSPDGNYLLVCDPSTSPYVWVLQRSGSTWAFVPAPNPGRTTRYGVFSPDGTKIALGYDNAVSGQGSVAEYSWPSNTLQPALSNQELNTACIGLAYSPDGAYLAAVFGTAVLWVWRFAISANLTKQALAGAPPALQTTLSWNRSSSKLAVAHNNTPFFSWFSVSGSSISKLSNPATLPSAAVGRAVAQLSNDDTLVGYQPSGSARLSRYNSALVKQTDPSGQPAGNPMFIVSTV